MSLTRISLGPTRLAVLVAAALTGGSLLATAPSPATTKAPAVDFAKEVWPVLEKSCLQCHDRGTAFSNLRLDSPEGIMKGGDLGKVVVPGKPDLSSLVVRVALPESDLDYMPIEGDGLTDEQIATLRRWIEEGANFGGWTGK